jgi:predicted nucleotidyltransferase
MANRNPQAKPWFEADVTDIDVRDGLSDRQLLLASARWFVKRERRVPGVERIALIGSLATDKCNPKDLDLLVSVLADAEIKPIATLARKTQGRCQRGRLGVDIFLAQGDEYVGRCCNYREPHPRVACGGNRCDHECLHLCRTSFCMATEVVNAPPIILWPEFSRQLPPPADVLEALDDIA